MVSPGDCLVGPGSKAQPGLLETPTVDALNEWRSRQSRDQQGETSLRCPDNRRVRGHLRALNWEGSRLRKLLPSGHCHRTHSEPSSLAGLWNDLAAPAGRKDRPHGSCAVLPGCLLFSVLGFAPATRPPWIHPLEVFVVTNSTGAASWSLHGQRHMLPAAPAPSM